MYLLTFMVNGWHHALVIDRIEALNKQIQGLESKSQSLQLTIDRLSTNLQKTEEEESNQKERVQSLNLTLSDNQAIINELQDRISQLQKGLTSSEHDRSNRKDHSC